jgi:uncharacterized protein YjdB
VNIGEGIAITLTGGSVAADKPSWTADGGKHYRDYTVTADSGKTKHYRVWATRDPPPLIPGTDVKVNPASLSLKVGESAVLTATV